MVKNALKKAPLANYAYKLLKKYRAGRDQRTAKARFKDQFDRFSALSEPGRFSLKWEERYPVLNEGTAQTDFDRHYVYHTAWAARCLAETKPVRHTDISSLLYFSALVSAFVPVDFYDFRPADIHLPNLSAKSANLTNLAFESNSIPSLSCMHTVEHIGLGRYGDELDPSGDLKAMKELQRVLARNGNLFFVVPVGRPRILFNAHRIYSYEQIIRSFPDLTLHKFSLITENFSDRGLIDTPPQAFTDVQDYACGCFWFKKK